MRFPDLLHSHDLLQNSEVNTAEEPSTRYIVIIASLGPSRGIGSERDRFGVFHILSGKHANTIPRNVRIFMSKAFSL